MGHTSRIKTLRWWVPTVTSFESKIKALNGGDDFASADADILTHGFPDGIVKDLGTGYKSDICNPAVGHSCSDNDFSSDSIDEGFSWYPWKSLARTNIANP
jgi:hypothetical protein